MLTQIKLGACYYNHRERKGIKKTQLSQKNQKLSWEVKIITVVIYSQNLSPVVCTYMCVCMCAGVCDHSSPQDKKRVNNHACIIVNS